MEKSKSRRYATFFIKLTISIGALFFVFSKLEIKAVADLVFKANWGFLLLALLMFAFSKFVSALRLNRFFFQISISMATVINLKLYLLGMFYNLFLPGGIGGDGYKIYLLQKSYKVKAKSVFWAVFLDRVSGLFALGILTLLLAATVPLLWPFRYLLLIIIPGAYGVAYFIVKKLFPEFISIFSKTNLQSLVVQSSQVISAYLILMAIAPDEFNSQYLFLFLISSIVSIVPITIGGAGAREFTFLVGSQFLNVGLSQSIALSLSFYIITVIVSFFGIFLTLGNFEDQLISTAKT